VPLFNNVHGLFGLEELVLVVLHGPPFSLNCCCCLLKPNVVTCICVAQALRQVVCKPLQKTHTYDRPFPPHPFPHPDSTITPPPPPGLFVAGALIPRLSVGLDQAVALPRDSYMQDYYR